MHTRATRNYLGIYQDIIENFAGDEMYNRLTQLDEIAEKCLTGAEFTDYTLSTMKYIKEVIR